MNDQNEPAKSRDVASSTRRAAVAAVTAAGLTAGAVGLVASDVHQAQVQRLQVSLTAAMHNLPEPGGAQPSQMPSAAALAAFGPLSQPPASPSAGPTPSPGPDALEEFLRHLFAQLFGGSGGAPSSAPM